MPEIPFAFQHAALRQTGARFEQTENREIVLVSSLGNLSGSIAIDKVAGALNLSPDSGDAKLLNLVTPSLKFKRALHAGDLLPSELIDGRPSWEPRPSRTGKTIRRLCLALGHEARLIDELATSDNVLISAYDDLAMAVSKYGLVKEAQLTTNDIVEVVDDLARIDWICKAIIGAQQCIGDLAKLSQSKPAGPKNEFARSAALGLRNAVKWATEHAMQLDAIAADPITIFSDVRRFQKRLWPALATLRAFALDSEPLVSRWGHLRLRPYVPGTNEIEALSRTISVRYVPFDAQLYEWQPIPSNILPVVTIDKPSRLAQE